MRGNHRPSRLRAPYRQCDHRDVSRGGALESSAKCSGLADRLQEKSHDFRRRDADRVIEIRRRGSDELLARGDRNRPTEVAARSQHRRERGAGAADQSEGPRGIGYGSTYPIARSPCSTLTNPMHPAPHTAMPASLAMEAIRALSELVPPVPASKAPPKITAERSPRSAARDISDSSEESGTPRRTRSTGPGISSSEPTQGRSSMLE